MKKKNCSCQGEPPTVPSAAGSMRSLINASFPHALFLGITFFTSYSLATEPFFAEAILPNTKPLTESRPLDEVMVQGIDRFALREIKVAATQRNKKWSINYQDANRHTESLQPFRQRLAKLIGAVDARVEPQGIQLVSTLDSPSLIFANEKYEVHRVKWGVLKGMDSEGLFLKPKGEVIARAVAIPDADWNPEQIAGLFPCPSQYAADLASAGVEVLVPTLVSRDSEFSSNPEIKRYTNLTHREFIYRQAFEVGRHVIGYEVQKVLSAVDQLERRNNNYHDLPIAVLGFSEGGLLAFYSAAIDDRIDATLVSGYFDQREAVWKEPIYRNVWQLLEFFGDAEIASMIAPRNLFIEMNPELPIVERTPSTARQVAAPGVLQRLDPKHVAIEVNQARKAWQATQKWGETNGGTIQSFEVTQDHPQPLSRMTIHRLLSSISTVQNTKNQALGQSRVKLGNDVTNLAKEPTDNELELIRQRQARTVSQMTTYTQRLLQLSHRNRDAIWQPLNRSSVADWEKEANRLRTFMHQNLIGRLPNPTIPMNPRSRKIIEHQAYHGYEVVLDVFPDVIASGVLLVPSDWKEGQRRPVVVCQHGLEGTPMDTIDESESRAFQAYKAFSVQLVKQGFIVYAPQNPYRGRDAFRTLQRKSNPLGRSLFSYIIPQHQATLNWLSTLPWVDPNRIGFYGLSYGGKTAVRVPPFLPPSTDQPGYALSICSADFNEWVAKNASTDAPFSYVWTPEYEIFEWNMGNLANYAELSMLMAPRPFMVERGHDDGVGIDEWVAWEYAKVRRHYDRLQIGDQTQIEFFDGPHTIHGQGTFKFLRKHLDWQKN